MNARLGNLGETVIVTDPVEHVPEDPTAGLPS